MDIALFDFDGTITKKDSFVDFIFFSTGKPKLFLGFVLLSPVILGYFSGIISSRFMKETVLTYLYKGWPFSDFKETAREYSRTRLKTILREGAVERIKWHKKRNHEVYVVTASLGEYLIDWCTSMDVKLLANAMEAKDGLITGKLASANCLGTEKVRRIKECVDISSYGQVYAYGNSKGDRDMLSLAHHPYYKPFTGTSAI